MWKLPILLSVAWVGIGGCAVDGQPDEADVETSAATQDSTVIDNCATGSTANASSTMTSTSGDSYSRSAAKINTTCGCAAWQVDMNAHGAAQADIDFPSCRPWTYYDVTVTGFGNAGDRVGAHVNSWQTTSKTECENSELDIAIQENVGGTWFAVWPTTLHHYVIEHPTFNPNTGSCEALEIDRGISDVGVYRIEARAVKGLDANNHGYAGVEMIDDAVNIK